MSVESNNWQYNIPIGSKIVIDDELELYIFYGYNFDKSIASCFPANSTYMIDKMIYVPIKAILSIYKYNSTLLEKEMENKLKI
jgi:hypothetical protein